MSVTQSYRILLCLSLCFGVACKSKKSASGQNDALPDTENPGADGPAQTLVCDGDFYISESSEQTCPRRRADSIGGIK